MNHIRVSILAFLVFAAILLTDFQRTAAQLPVKQIPINEVIYRDNEVVAIKGLLVGKMSRISVYKEGRIADNLWVFYIDENPEDQRLFKLRSRILVLFKSDQDMSRFDLTKPLEVTGIATARIGKIWALNFIPGLNLEAGFKELRIEATEIKQP